MMDCKHTFFSFLIMFTYCACLPLQSVAYFAASTQTHIHTHKGEVCQASYYWLLSCKVTIPQLMSHTSSLLDEQELQYLRKTQIVPINPRSNPDLLGVSNLANHYTTAPKNIFSLYSKMQIFCFRV